MAKNIYEITNLVTTMPDGTLIYGATPGGVNPDPFTDARITKANFFAPLQTQITTNAGNITTNATNITTLQNNSSKRLDSSQTTSYSFTQVAGSMIETVYFNGTGTVSVGTTPAGEELVKSALITDGFRSYDVDPKKGYSAASRTIYITLTAASVDVATFSKLSLFI